MAESSAVAQGGRAGLELVVGGFRAAERGGCPTSQPLDEPGWSVPGSGAQADLWQERALCAQTDPESFFPEKGGSTREAKRICTGCEVRDECLEFALANDERFGIWGGLSERERRRLKRGSWDASAI